MSLLQKYGALVMRGGKIAMAAAMECINKCCAKYVCAYRSPVDDPDEGQDCYPKGTEPGSVLGEYGSEKECLKYCETQYVCAYRDSETPAERECYPSTDDDPNLIVLSEHDTKRECEEDCEATYVCAYRSIDPAKGRFCSKKTDPLDPELIVLAEYDSLKQCEDNCDEGYVCAYPAGGSDADRACKKDDGDPSFVILTEHGSLKECEEFCYEGKYVCAYKSEDPAKGRACYKATDDDPSLIVLSEHNSLGECEYACVDDTGACCLYKCEYTCATKPCEQVWSRWEKDADGVCVEVFKDASDTDEIWASNGCDVFRSTDITADISLCDESPESGSSPWTIIGSSKEKCEAVEEEYYECLDGYTEGECEAEAERRAVYYRWTGGALCEDVSCNCGRYGCVLSYTGAYECAAREDIADPGLVLSWHNTLEECKRECDPEVGACCIRDCDCSPGNCVQTHVYFYKPSNGVGCIGVIKETSDDEEIWISDGCDVWATNDTGALGGEPFLEKCPDNKDGWRLIGFSLEKCRGVVQDAVCHDGYTEEQCREEAERLGAAYTWTGGAKCDDVVCTCLVWVCKGEASPGFTCEIPTYRCEEVYAPQGDDFWNTKEECEEGCGESICSYEYPNDYSCHPYGADVSGFTVPTDLCAMACCGRCDTCHTLNDELQFANSTAGGGANGWEISASTCVFYTAYKPVGPGADACGFPDTDRHDGDWLEGSIHFRPCNSPFIGAYNRVADPPHPPIPPGGGFSANYKIIPLPVDDCNGDGCDCNWANYDLALRYEAGGVRIGIFRSAALATRVTLTAGSECNSGPNGGIGDTYSVRTRYRALAYDCASNKWQDVSDCLLKRTEMEYYLQNVGGPLAVPPDPEYIEPLEPGMVCTAPPENPFP